MIIIKKESELKKVLRTYNKELLVELCYNALLLLVKDSVKSEIIKEKTK